MKTLLFLFATSLLIGASEPARETPDEPRNAAAVAALPSSQKAPAPDTDRPGQAGKAEGPRAQPAPSPDSDIFRRRRLNSWPPDMPHR